MFLLQRLFCLILKYLFNFKKKKKEINTEYSLEGLMLKPNLQFLGFLIPTCAGSSKKQESSRKTSISVLLSKPKTLTVWIKINCRKF